jgi:hypothetical protein
MPIAMLTMARHLGVIDRAIRVHDDAAKQDHP